MAVQCSAPWPCHRWSVVYPHAYFSDQSNIKNGSYRSFWLYEIFWWYFNGSYVEFCEECVGVKCTTHPSNPQKLLSLLLNRALTYHSRVIFIHSHTWSEAHAINFLLSTMVYTHISIIAFIRLLPHIQVNCNIIYEKRWKFLTWGGVRDRVKARDVSCIMMVVTFIIVFIGLRRTEHGLNSETSN